MEHYPPSCADTLQPRVASSAYITSIKQQVFDCVLKNTSAF